MTLVSASESAALAACLGDLDFFCRHRIDWVEETGSTNDDLKATWFASDGEPAMLIAGRQTAGRGQFARRWYSQASQCLMFSFTSEALPGGFPPSLIAGIAMYMALEKHCGRAPDDLWLKWPNDLWYGAAKLAGILTESCLVGNRLKIVTGVGINLLPIKIDNIATAAVSDFATDPGHAGLLQLFCLAFAEICCWPADALISRWAASAGRFWHTRFLVSENAGEEFVALPKRLETDGRLTLINEKGLQKTVVSATLKPLFY